MPWSVVVVDDDAPMRSLLHTLLSYDPDFAMVGEASDGAEAIQVIDLRQPDLVLLDWHMPGMEGLAALPEIRQRASTAVVVVLSGSISSGSIALAAGADSFYPKTPALAAHLADDLKQLMNSHDPRK